MRTVLVILDGLADEPVPALRGRTPLEAAHTPHLDRLAAGGRTGAFAPIPPGMRAGSEVGVPVCLGLDAAFAAATGRATLEALGRGVRIAPDDLVLRATCVHLQGDLQMPGARLRAVADPASTFGAVAALAREGVLGVRLVPDPEGRHLAVLPGARDAECGTAPPHDLVGLPLALGGRPFRPAIWAALARRLPGDLCLWPWAGPGVRESAGVASESPFGAVVTGVDLVRGIARQSGIEAPEVPGATGREDSDFAAKARAALRLLDRHPRVAVHVEAPDMAAHRRDPRAKARLLSRIDRDLIGALAAAGGDLHLVVTGDHGTSSCTGRHLEGPVPFVAGNAAAARPGGGARRFHEAAVAGVPVCAAAAWRGLLLGEAVAC